MARHAHLGDLIRVKHGYAFSGKEFSEDPELPVVVTPGNFEIGGGFKEANRAKTFAGIYSGEFELDPGDLILSMTDLSKAGDTLGAPAFVPGGRIYLHNQRIGRVVKLPNTDINTDYLGYRLRLQDFRQFILSTATGTTVRHTSPQRIHEFEIDIPSVPTQKSIADVLRALDGKIAANTRTLQVLDSLGEVAVEQRASTISPDRIRSVASIAYGKALPATKRSSGNVLVYGSGGVVGTHNTALVDGPGIVIGRKGTVGALHWADGSHFPIDTTYYVVPKAGVSPYILYYALRKARLNELNSDSAVPGLNRDEAYDQQVRVPSGSASEPLAEQLERQFELARSLRDQSRRLAHTRDQLIPLLMSGKVTVMDIEGNIEDIV
ncbi:restriction endonuclease subunit S [Gordonia sp. UCD-TK1]|uniref:restriction endonuclease subunit S n=1 Tax=Gordonia sp. UCD-TK1 TaxID=1857893 RepID=UPI00080E73CB|nr:restriction endonuclease subunit S [Gordonia sp. UCD-TK1]OCH78792.1 hypothetical protein A9310_10355 [Gordonia sp. UCD-TK1]